MSAMSEHRKTEVKDIDLTILERISEADVVAWMVAKMHHLRGTSDPTFYHLDLDCWRRDYYRETSYDTSFGVSLAGGRGFTHPTVESALVAARLEQANQPLERAKKKRAKARDLNEEAATLEQLAVKVAAGGCAE